jgi:small subunit ribosomal protein S19
MTRSLWKGPFSEQTTNSINDSNKIPRKITEQFIKNKIWSRRSVILPAFLNKELLIYNGKLFIPLKVSEEMIGHKYGEFASTRKKPIHKKKRK